MRRSVPLSPALVAELRARDPEYQGQRQDRVRQVDPVAARLAAVRWAAQRHAEIEQQRLEMERLIIRICIGFCSECDRPVTTPPLRRLHPECGRYGVLGIGSNGLCSTCDNRIRNAGRRAATGGDS